MLFVLNEKKLVYHPTEEIAIPFHVFNHTFFDFNTYKEEVDLRLKNFIANTQRFPHREEILEILFTSLNAHITLDKFDYSEKE